MPSPLGHALGGFAAGWLVAERSESADDGAPRRPWPRGVAPRALAFAALGMAADLDLLVGRHSQLTHSIGATLVVGVATYAWLRLTVRARRAVHGRARREPFVGAPLAVLALAAAAAYGSHVVLDWLAQDATPPRGITALWPFTSSYYLSGLDLFRGISRQPWRPGAAWHDVLAVTRELVVLGPVALAAWWLRRRGPRQILPRAARRRVQPLRPRAGLPSDSESL